MKPWFVYILLCADKTLYTGITTDLDRRLIEHNAPKSISKYTRARQPVTMVYKEQTETRSSAGKREVFIKSLTRAQKQLLIKQHCIVSRTKTNTNTNKTSKTKIDPKK